jgi:SAM-dependent methyltransferase
MTTPLKGKERAKSGRPRTAARAGADPERIMRFGFGYVPPLMLEAAIRHRVFDVLDEGRRTVEQVGAATGASIRGLRALMNALVGLELLAKDARGFYSLTPESAAFLVSGKPGFRGGLFRHASTRVLPRWLQLSEVVRTGRPAASVNREKAGAKFFSQFVEDLFPMSYPAAQVLARALRVARARREVRVLDLAAGSGAWGIALAQESPRVRVTAVDWAGVIPVTRRFAARYGLAGRFRFVKGDLLQARFGRNYTIATLGHILHGEGETRSRALLKKTFDALAPGGTIAIADWLVNETRTGPPHALIFALNMLVSTDEGNTFSLGEIRGWLHQAGFENVRTLEAPGPSPLIRATKPSASNRK